jgi:hypothetical protein
MALAQTLALADPAQRFRWTAPQRGVNLKWSLRNLVAPNKTHRSRIASHRSTLREAALVEGLSDARHFAQRGCRRSYVAADDIVVRYCQRSCGQVKRVPANRKVLEGFSPAVAIHSD